MKVTADKIYTEEMLREAMEMLGDFQHHMGLFQRQQYGKLKRRFDQHGKAFRRRSHYPYRSLSHVSF